MGFRKLRIGFSALCGLAAVLLIVLWLRSYSSIGSLKTRYYLLEVFVSTYRGLLISDVNFNQTSHSNNIPNTEWVTDSFPMRETFTYYLADVRRAHSFLGFRWNSDQSIYEVALPFWFLVFLTGSLAVFPWVRQLRCRFSLRTLLIVTTLVAIALGLVAAAAQ
jgi:hypothetical protein